MQIDVPNIPLVVQQLRQLPEELQAKAIPPALKASATILTDALYPNIPTGSGLLQTGITMKVGKRSAGVFFQTDAMPQLLKVSKKTGIEHFYGAVQEYGSTKRNIPAKGFMQRTFAEAHSPAIDAGLAAMETAISRINQQMASTINSK